MKSYCQGLTRRKPRIRCISVSRETSVRLWAIAVAAMRLSIAGNGPIWSWLIRAHTFTVSNVTTKTRSANAGTISLSIQLSRIWLLAVSFNRSAPDRISPIDKTLKYKLLDVCSKNHFCTAAWGFLRLVSDNMFVSSKKPLVLIGRRIFLARGIYRAEIQVLHPQTTHPCAQAPKTRPLFQASRCLTNR